MINLGDKYQKRRFLYSFSCFNIILIFFIASCFVGCTIDSDTLASNELMYNNEKSADDYFQLMRRSTETPKTDLYLMAIRSLIKEHRFAEASQHISNLPLFLSDVQKNEKALIVADLAIRQQQKSDLASIDLRTLTHSQRIYFYCIKLLQDKLLADSNAIARDYIVLEKMSPTKEKRQLIEETWTFFKSLSHEQLKNIIVFYDEMTLKGWVDLAYAYGVESSPPSIEHNQMNPTIFEPSLRKQDRINTAMVLVSEWQLQYPSHPAAVFVPRELNFGRRSSVSDPSKTVALLLPLKGIFKSFGQAVKAGYMDAAHFYPNEEAQRVIILDTTRGSVASLINQAREQGAELIVGPLLKGEVVTLAKQSSPLPILALNKPTSKNDRSGDSSSGAKICYFSLSPEDEAISAARHIFKQGKKKPLIITAKTPLGVRIVTAFDREWHRLSQDAVYVQYFESLDKLKETMNRGIGLFVSGEPVDSTQPFNDHQNSDIDAIYVFSTQEELEFIKPMLDMPYPVGLNESKMVKAPDKKWSENRSSGGVPPLYVSSHGQVFSDLVDYRYEMENVQFSEIPLLVAKNVVYSSLPPAIKADYALAKLYAMGIDARRLANRFERLTASRKKVLKGLTGSMTVSPNCEIDRELLWHVYRKGQVIII